MEEANRIIFGCVDSALSDMGFVDKSAFYRILEQSYGIKPQEIGEKFELFHKYIKTTFGFEHFRFERLLIKTLHRRREEGLYNSSAEIEAFTQITKVFIAESEEHVKAVKELSSAKKYAEHLKKRAGLSLN